MSWLDLTNTKTADVSYDVLPVGTYLVQCVQADLTTTKSGTGEYIKARFKIVEGKSTGRIVFHNFNIKNANPKATEIGHEQLKSFLLNAKSRTLALTSPKDLEGLSCSAKIKVKKDEKYGDSNEISYFTAYELPASSVKSKSTNFVADSDPF